MDKIRIKEMNGTYSCGGYFYAKGKKLKPGETVEVEDAEPHVATGHIEVVGKKRRAAKVQSDEETTTQG